jgi:hypothetical protein
MAFTSWEQRSGRGAEPLRRSPGPREKSPEKKCPAVSPFKKIPHKYLAYENLLKYYYLTIGVPRSSRGKR